MTQLISPSTGTTPAEKRSFPDNFLFGVATAAATINAADASAISFVFMTIASIF